MKKLFIFLAISSMLLSCRKNYNCRCNTTILYTNGQEYFVSRNTAMNEKMTEKQAKAVCAHERDNLQQTYQNIYTNNGTASTGGVRFTSNCTLE